MQELDDNSLLRQYVDNHSEEAFAALVARHINKVYSVALRHTRNPSEAEEITQAAFVILAKKANGLSKRVILSGWLYHTARLTSVTFLRSEIRRSRREKEAHLQSTLTETLSDETWMQMAPLLDAAMAGLNETDRHAVVLRFFDGKSIHEVGEALGSMEDAAKIRLSRALEILQGFLARRGVYSTTAIIAGAISSYSVQVAPLTLAKSVTIVAMTKGMTATGSTSALVKGVLKMMTLQKIKIPAIVATFVILAAGTTGLAVKHASEQNSVPYRVTDDFWRLFNSVDTNRLKLQIILTSTNKSVRPEDICLTIHSAIKGPILVHPSTNGLIVDFPDDPVLRRENPDVTVNQPSESLGITVWCWMPTPEALTFDYRQLGDGVAEAKNAFAKAGTIVTPGNVGWVNYVAWLFTPGFKVNGMVLYFPAAKVRASIKIMAKEGVQTYWADRNGLLKLKLDKTLLQENPEVIVSKKPYSVWPDFVQTYWWKME